MTRIKDRYWIETDTFIETSNITQKLQTEGIQGTKYPNIKTPQSKVSNPTISDSAANFSRVYSPSSIASNSSIQLPEYFLEEFSRPPSPNPHEYPIRVNSKIVRTLNEDPRYTVLPARFINNSSLSTQRKQRELRRLQEQQLTLKFEVEVTFNSLGPHPFSLSTRVAHKTTPSPFIVTSISYLCDADLPEIRTGHINFFNPYSGLNYRSIF